MSRYRARKTDLVGRTIVDVDFRPFRSQRDDYRPKAHNPVFVLDNGKRVWFVVEETEMEDYGVNVCITRKEQH